MALLNKQKRVEEEEIQDSEKASLPPTINLQAKTVLQSGCDLGA